MANRRISKPDPKVTDAKELLRLLAAKERKELETDFPAYFRESFKHIQPGIEFTESWHYDLISEYLQYAASGQMKLDNPALRGLIINVPPRTMKSTQVNISWPTYVWTTQPQKKFLCISYGAELAVNEISAKRRKLLADPWFLGRWKNVRIQDDINLKHRYDTTEGGYMIATTPGGFASGSGADIIIIDDICPLEARSVYGADRENGNSFYENTLKSRLNNPATGYFVVIAQRLHDEDLPGHLLKNEPGQWLQVVVPLECEEDTEYIFPVSGKKFVRKKGDVLMPSRFEPHTVIGYKKNSRTWAGQYQQKPMPASGLLINPNWWQYYEGELPAFSQVILSVDCAFKGTQSSDFVAIEKWGIVNNRKYLIEVTNERLSYTATKTFVRSMCINGLKPSIVLIEEAANGAAIIDELKREGLPAAIIAVTPDGGKLSRAMAASPEVEAGNCYLPKDAPWLQAFIKQLAEGTEGATNDDMIDSFSQCINWVRGHRYAYYDDYLAGKYGAKPPTSEEVVKQIKEYREKHGIKPISEMSPDEVKTLRKKQAMEDNKILLKRF